MIDIKGVMIIVALPQLFHNQCATINGGIFQAGFKMFFILEPSIFLASKCPDHRSNETFYLENFRFYALCESFVIFALRSQNN